MYTLTQEQVNELVKGKSIQEVLPGAFKLKVGKWYKCPERGQAMFFIREIIGDDVYGYGLNYEGTWRDNGCFCPAESTSNEPASHEEVEEMLIAEAKKRGFVKGANVEGLDYYLGVLSLGKCMGQNSGYKYSGNKLVANISTNRNAVIFENGKWATIVPESKGSILTELIDYATTNDNLWLKNQLEKLR